MSLPLFIDPSEFIKADRPNDLIIVDLGKAERFEQEHIPGALLVTPAETQAGPPIPGLIPSLDAIKQLFLKLGISSDKHILVYDDEGGGWAGRFIWMLDELGHRAYSYLDGGLVAWKAENGPLESGASQASPLSEEPSLLVSGEHTVEIEQLLNTLPDQSCHIWDARSPKEYRAEKLNAKRGGHIPGAINYEWTDAMDQTRALRLKPLDTLKKELSDIGIDGSKMIVTHCQTHHRSGLTYLIAKLLGYEVKAYAGSWGEWGNREDTPIEI